MSSEVLSLTDTRCVAILHAIDSALPSGLLDRSNRQQEKGSYASHEMRVFPSTE